MSEFMLQHPELWGQLVELLVIALVILLAQGKIPFRTIANVVLTLFGKKPLPNGNGKHHAEEVHADLINKLQAHDQQNQVDFAKMEKLITETKEDVHALHIELASIKGYLNKSREGP